MRLIKGAQQLGFTLAEIRELLSLRLNHDRGSFDIRALAEAKISDIDAKIQTLSAMKKALADLTSQCSGSGPANECPIVESIDSDDELQ